jgi:ABC-2 type transport system permease protein
MFTKLAKFEFNYFRKQPSFIVVALIFFTIAFLAMSIEEVTLGGSGSNLNFNSPQTIFRTMIIMSLIGMFLVANFVGGTATRDYTHKMNGIIHALPTSKGNYLWGRLLGAFIVCLIIFLAVPLGTILGSLMPWVDADRLGDTSLLPYIKSYLIFIIPNFIFMAAMFYSFAMLTRTMMGMYLGVVGFFVLYNVTAQLLRDPSMLTMAAMLDPFGIRAFSQVTRYWTTHEMNTQMVNFEGIILQNRILWLSISTVIVALSHYLIDIRKIKNIKDKKSNKTKNLKFNKEIITITPTAANSSQWLRFKERTKLEFNQVIKSPAFVILSLLTIFNLSSLILSSTGSFGTDNWPITSNLSLFISGAFSLFMLIIITYYAGESIWRERQLGIGDIVDSTPTSNWALYFPKVLALYSVVFILSLVGVLFTLLFQVSKGYSNFEFGVYFNLLLTNLLIPMFMLLILSLIMQILTPNKYLGMLLFVIFIIASPLLSELGLEHGLWDFASTPYSPFSDMNQYGHFAKSLFAYNMYWFGFTVILMILGYGLFRRGAEYGLKNRWSQLSNNLGTNGFIVMVTATVLFVGMGSYIYYNTVILNKFITEDEQTELQVNYENTYKQFEKYPITKITDVNVNVDIFPEQRKVMANGYYLLKNKTNSPIEKQLIIWDEKSEVTIDMKGAELRDFDETFNTGWLHFNPAIKSGETRQMNFTVLRQAKGFVDGGSDNTIVANGSFINNQVLLPHFGYNSGYEISDRQERKKRDMSPPQRMAKLEDESMYRTGFVGPEADFINYEAIVSTSEDQFAITPGYIQKDWIENGRHYYHYKMDVPIFNFFAFLSGKYEVLKENYKGINIEVYYHPTHNKNVAIMQKAVEKSLDYYKQEFSPYQYRQVRIIEFPRYASFAQSFSNTIPYSEDIGFIADLRDEDNIDWVSFVTAHEMGHQWWGHQVTPANVQGSAVLSESLSEYSAYLVMEQLYGEHHLRKFLKYEMDRYLRGRSGEILEELPLMRAENQQYIHYPKGGVVMYSLKDRLGEKKFNSALRKFLEEFKYKSDPYPTTLDLIRHIKAVANSDDIKFIDDMFTKITLFDLKTKKATAKKLANGNYQVELTIEADKYYADGKGEETKDVVDDYFDIGIFSSDPDTAKGDEHVLKFDKEFIKTGMNTLTFEVKELPKYAGVDPYIKMIDRNSNDNMVRVELLK